jgi:hypothetical protein
LEPSAVPLEGNAVAVVGEAAAQAEKNGAGTFVNHAVAKAFEEALEKVAQLEVALGKERRMNEELREAFKKVPVNQQSAFPREIQESRLKMEEDARLKAAEEAKQKAEEEARVKAAVQAAEDAKKNKALEESLEKTVQLEVALGNERRINEELREAFATERVNQQCAFARDIQALEETIVKLMTDNADLKVRLESSCASNDIQTAEASPDPASSSSREAPCTTPICSARQVPSPICSSRTGISSSSGRTEKALSAQKDIPFAIPLENNMRRSGTPMGKLEKFIERTQRVNPE